LSLDAISGEFESDGRKVRFSADVSFKVDVIVHPEIKRKEPERFEEPTRVPVAQKIGSRVSTTIKEHVVGALPTKTELAYGGIFVVGIVLLSSEDVYAGTSLVGTEADYEKGFMNSYGQTNFENDFNEYAAMVFAYPEKFKQIMNQYPRVRCKFLVFLDFYQKIDPIFTEEYFFGTHASDHDNRPASSADCSESPSSAGARLK